MFDVRVAWFPRGKFTADFRRTRTRRVISAWQVSAVPSQTPARVFGLTQLFVGPSANLQVPAGDMGEGVTAYKEVTLASEIARELMEAGFLGAPETNGSQGPCLDDLVLENAGFHSFASFRTNREKFRCVRLCVGCDAQPHEKGVARPHSNPPVANARNFSATRNKAKKGWLLFFFFHQK